MRTLPFVVMLLVAVACGASSTDATDARSPDTVTDLPAESGPEPLAEIAGEADVPPEAEAPPDAAPEADAPADVPADVPAPDDADEADATPGVPLPGFGALSGDCGVIDEAVWASSEPLFVQNHLDFGDDPYDEADYDLLTPGAQTIYDLPNAGGSSKDSEAFAAEVLTRCELATFLKTEMQILYRDPQGKITDLLVQIDGRKTGVSVTRAMSWPLDDPYSPDAASALLVKKLEGIQASTANVAPTDAWARQILSVMAYGPAHAEVLHQAWQTLSADLRGDTIVYVTVTDGDDAFLY
jgi:hypothetical protein